MITEIRGGQVLDDQGHLQERSVRIEGVVIRGLGPPGATATASDAGTVIDAQGLLVLPGIVDLHGDAFERQLMPRPGVHFDHALALLDTDRQLIANGITTAYHGLTLSWEPGLRGDAGAEAFLAALETVRPLLCCDTRLHLRFETYHLDAVDRVIGWLGADRIDLLAFNDHVDMIADKVARGGELATYTSRTGLTPAGFRDLLDRVRSRHQAVPDAIRRLAAAARRHGVPMASHDDETPAMRRWYRELGCRLCEFPVDLDTARDAAAHGDHIILGAPNVVRGGSHARRLTAHTAVGQRLCTALTSDYYYPSLLQAAFRLVRDGVMALGDAWRLVAAGPAKAVGLDDRGVIAPGRRADLVVVDASLPALPRVVATFVAGRPVFVTDRRGPAEHGRHDLSRSMLARNQA